MNPVVDLTIESVSWSVLPDLPTLVERAVASAARESGATLPVPCEVSCLFCDDAEMQALNARWRGQDKPTNVLSFPAGGPGGAGTPTLLGDIVLAFETVDREATRDGKRLEDHVSHLVVHGFLHLLGYDHETDIQARTMERLEARILGTLGIGDPFEDGSVTAAS